MVLEMAKGALSRQPAPPYVIRGAQDENEQSGKRPDDAWQTFPTRACEHTMLQTYGGMERFRWKYRIFLCRTVTLPSAVGFTVGGVPVLHQDRNR